jgi:hypothetical protein
MAHLWIIGKAGEWTTTPLAASTLSLDTLPPRPLPAGLPRRGRKPAPGAYSALLLHLRGDEHGREEWALIAGAPGAVLVNGAPVILGIKLLSDRDALSISGVGRCYFSTELLARVEEFPGSEAPVFCPRCQQEIEGGTTAVRCPGADCGVWHHQRDELPCWTYDRTCGAGCSQSTDLDAGYRWTPDEEHGRKSTDGACHE